MYITRQSNKSGFPSSTPPYGLTVVLCFEKSINNMAYAHGNQVKVTIPADCHNGMDRKDRTLIFLHTLSPERLHFPLTFSPISLAFSPLGNMATL